MYHFLLIHPVYQHQQLVIMYEDMHIDQKTECVESGHQSEQEPLKHTN